MREVGRRDKCISVFGTENIFTAVGPSEGVLRIYFVKSIYAQQVCAKALRIT